MASGTGVAGDNAVLQINVFDGTRNKFTAATDILYRVIDGNQKQIYSPIEKKASIACRVPFYNNFGDNYTVIVWADGYHQAGFTPIKLSRSHANFTDLMLIPKESRFNFSMAAWDRVKLSMPFLGSGVEEKVARSRYEDLMEKRPKSLAALLNITTAMSQIYLPKGTALDYLKQIKWDDSLAQDRFFAYCDPQLMEQVRLAAARGLFALEVGAGFFHTGATASWKQVQFGEANVQLTFHEGDQVGIDGMQCIAVEPDIDYYKDLGAHALLEVISNSITGGLTNPETVYVLRWIAGHQAGIPEFEPPYTIEK